MTVRNDHETTQRANGPMRSRTFWVLGNNITVLANHADTGGRYDLLEGRQPPGNQTPPHRHTRYDEQFYVLDGEVTVWAARRKVILHRGDTFTIPAGTVHVVAATSSTPAHSLVIASPSGFAQLIDEVGTPDTGSLPPPPSAAELERFGRASARLGDENFGPPGALPEQ